MNLQNIITASQGRVKMVVIAMIPQLDTHACARMITLGTTANVSIIAIMYICLYFNNLLWMANSYIIRVVKARTQYQISVYMINKYVMHILLLYSLRKERIKYINYPQQNK